MAVVTEGLAVVGDKEDGGVVIHSLRLERIGDPSDLIVHKGNAGVVEILRAADIHIGHIHRIIKIERGREKIFQIGCLLGNERSLGHFTEKLMPGRGRAERRMRVDEGGHQKERLFGIAFLDELDRAVADPLCRMRLRRKLADLRNVVHLASHSVVVENVLVGRIHNILRVIVLGMRKLLLRMAAAEAHKTVSVPDVVHLADATGLKASLCQHRVKSLARVAGLRIVVGVARAVYILSRKERKTRGNANG